MVVKTIIWHNPKCSKSRQALELLIKGNVFPKIRLYLQEPPSKNEIREVLSILKLNAIDIVRKIEPEYESLNPYILKSPSREISRPHLASRHHCIY